MHNLPPTRSLKTIESCIDKTGFSVDKIKTSEYLPQGKYPVVDQGKNLIAGYYSGDGKVYDGNLPVVIYGDHTNVVKFVDFPFICGADGIKVFNFNQGNDPKYFYYALTHLGPKTQGYRRHYSLLKEIKLPLPPLPTQLAIVSKLDSIHASISANKASIQEQLKKLDEMWESGLSEAMSDSKRTTITFNDKSVIEIVDGDRGSNYPKKSEFTGEGFCLFLNTSNVRKGFRDLEKLEFISKERDELLRKGKIKIDDVILTTRGTIGNCAHVSPEFLFSHVRINSGMVILRVNQSFLLPTFLIKILLSKVFRDQVSEKTSGSAQPQLPITVMKSIGIPLPPIDIQDKIVTHLDHLNTSLSTLRDDYTQQLAHYDELRASALDQAFRGKLVNE